MTRTSEPAGPIKLSDVAERLSDLEDRNLDLELRVCRAENRARALELLVRHLLEKARVGDREQLQRWLDTASHPTIDPDRQSEIIDECFPPDVITRLTQG